MLLPRFASALLLAGVVSLTSLSGTSFATTFAGSGTNAETGNSVSASASFLVSGDVLTIELTNTTAGGTTLRGDVLQGIAWDYNGGSFTLGFPTVALTSGTDKYTDQLTVDNTGAYDGYTNVLGSAPISEYGVSSTGFSNAFSAGTIPSGGGGTDFGIVASGTFPAPPGAGTNSSFNSSAFPLFQNSLTFSLTGATGLDTSKIINVQFLFGTDGTGTIDGSSNLQSVPEPSTMALGSLALAAVLGNAWRRRTSCN